MPAIALEAWTLRKTQFFKIDKANGTMPYVSKCPGVPVGDLMEGKPLQSDGHLLR